MSLARFVFLPKLNLFLLCEYRIISLVCSKFFILEYVMGVFRYIGNEWILFHWIICSFSSMCVCVCLAAARKMDNL